jgi:hypothetical protein
MSDIKTPEYGSSFACPYSAGTDFGKALERAGAMLESGDVNGALELLENLEQQYIRGVRLFDVIGDLLLRQGKVEPGIRYKTLHEILRGTFQIAAQEKKAREAGVDRKEVEWAPTSESPRQGPRPRGRKAEPEVEPDASGLEPVFPVTAEMAHEFMRQGHFDRALAIFNTLIEKRPGDESLISARSRARKKSSEKVVLNLLQGWLENIQKMRRELSTGP